MQCSPNAIVTAAGFGEVGSPSNKALAMPILPQTVMASEIHAISKNRLMLRA